MKYKLKGPNKKCVPKKKSKWIVFQNPTKKSPNKNVIPIKKSSKPHLSSSFSFFTQGKAREDRALIYPWN